MLDNGWEQSPEHPYLEAHIAGDHIFDLSGILVELQVDVADSIDVVGKGNPFGHPVHESGFQRVLVCGTQVDVRHIRVQVCFPLGVEGIRIDPRTHVIQLHLCRIPYVHAVDLDRCIKEQETKDHVDCQYDEYGKKR